MDFDWLKSYRQIIHSHESNLKSVDLNFLREDETSIVFGDTNLEIVFFVEPNSDVMSVHVKYEDPSSNAKIYALNRIMELFYDKDMSPLFIVKSDEDKKRVVELYIKFIIENRKTLFMQNFPLEEKYDEMIRKDGIKMKEMFERHE